jgi:peptide/nickel transport system permease protein
VDDAWLNMLDSMTHMLLPTIALMIISLAAYTRYARASLLDVMNQDYVRTARAKGLGERTVVMRHAFRNAMIPIATIIALDFGAVIGGAVITERVFAWQAMGSLFNECCNDRLNPRGQPKDDRRNNRKTRKRNRAVAGCRMDGGQWCEA